MSRVGISDCDHATMEQEYEVFEKSGHMMQLHQCRTEEELIEQMGEYMVVANQYAPFTARVFEHLPNLKCIVRYGVGVDNIDLNAASAHQVCVCNVPDYGVQEVAAHAVTMMLALCRKLVPMNASVMRGEWKYEMSMPIYRFSEITIGMVGIGRIGKRFAQIVKGLDVRIVAFDSLYNYGENPYPEYIELVEMDELLRISDVISIHIPLENNRNMIGEAQLRAMKKSAYLINVSRGGIIDEEALEKALQEGWIAGAACDVLAKEPPVGIHPLCRFDNFLCTPHMAWYSEQSSRDMKRKVAEEIVRFLEGEALQNQLN